MNQSIVTFNNQNTVLLCMDVAFIVDANKREFKIPKKSKDDSNNVNPTGAIDISDHDERTILNPTMEQPTEIVSRTCYIHDNRIYSCNRSPVNSQSNRLKTWDGAGGHGTGLNLEDGYGPRGLGRDGLPV